MSKRKDGGQDYFVFRDDMQQHERDEFIKRFRESHKDEYLEDVDAEEKE